MSKQPKDAQATHTVPAAPAGPPERSVGGTTKHIHGPYRAAVGLDLGNGTYGDIAPAKGGRPFAAILWVEEEYSAPELEATGRLLALAPDLLEERDALLGETATLREERAEMLEALRDLAHIARMYHKGEEPGHLDACENPDNCGHCRAMRKVRPILDKLGKD